MEPSHNQWNFVTRKQISCSYTSHFALHEIITLMASFKRQVKQPVKRVVKAFCSYKIKHIQLKFSLFSWKLTLHWFCAVCFLLAGPAAHRQRIFFLMLIPFGHVLPCWDTFPSLLLYRAPKSLECSIIPRALFGHARRWLKSMFLFVASDLPFLALVVAGFAADDGDTATWGFGQMVCSWWSKHWRIGSLRSTMRLQRRRHKICILNCQKQKFCTPFTCCF